MIYDKNANYPYPILTNDSTSYKNGQFSFDCCLSYKDNNYAFQINDLFISSKFIKDLLKTNKASLYLIIDSSDSHFIKIDNDNLYIEISKKEISLKKNIKIQLMIKADYPITFSNNNDLLDFYDNVKNSIKVNRGNLLGFSNVLQYNGSMKKPYQLYNKRVDPNIENSIEFDLNDEFITIVFKDKEYEFNDLPKSRDLNNPYLLMGLQKALLNFIINYQESNNTNDNNVKINEYDPESDLDIKLKALLLNKGIDYLDYDNITETSFKLNDNIIEKFNSAVRGLENGN